MNHRTIAIIFLIIILMIMPYYQGLKECIENPDYDASIPNKYQYSELLNDYIYMLKDVNLALYNDNEDGYAKNFNTLFTTNIKTL